MGSMELRRKLFKRLPQLKSGVAPVPKGQRFWDWYKTHKADCRDAGIVVQKDDDGNWILKAYPYEDPKLKYYREIAEMRDRHLPVCRQCGQTTTTIDQRTMSNNVTQFSFVCKHCNCKISSALPHQLVEFLVSKEDYQIIQGRERYGYNTHTSSALRL